MPEGVPLPINFGKHFIIRTDCLVNFRNLSHRKYGNELNTPATGKMDKSSPTIDISLPMHPKMPKWPGSEGIKIHRMKRLEGGDKVNNSKLECDVHSGTYVDAPLHFIEDGSTVEALPLDMLIGPVIVATIPEAQVVTAKHLASIGLPPKTERLLLRTRNSDLWASNVTEFRENYTALTADAAQWLVDRGIGLVGIDYLSIQIFSDPPIYARDPS